MLQYKHCVMFQEGPSFIPWIDTFMDDERRDDVFISLKQ